MRRALIVAALCLWASGASAQITFVTSEQITIDNTTGGVPFTATKISPGGQPQTSAAYCTLETADIRYTVDGSAPTASVGTLWTAGNAIAFSGHEVLAAFKGIRTGST